MGRNGKGIYVRVHPKSWKKFKSRLKELSSRKRCQSIKPSLEKIKVYARGWLNYYGIASMKNNIDDINGYRDDMSMTEIAEQLEIDKTTAYRHKKRLIVQIYDELNRTQRKGRV